jgi:hypothetical protein
MLSGPANFSLLDLIALIIFCKEGMYRPILEFSSACFLDLLQNNDWFNAPQNARNVIPPEQLLPAQDALYIVLCSRSALTLPISLQYCFLFP